MTLAAIHATPPRGKIAQRLEEKETEVGIVAVDAALGIHP